MRTMAAGRLLRWSPLFGLPLLVTLASCGHVTRDYQEYHRVTASGEFSKRDLPAEHTTLTDAELSLKGYAHIGIIDIVSVQPPDMDDVKREAAQKGADLITADSATHSGKELTTTCTDLLSQTNDMTGGGGHNFSECEHYVVEETTVTLSVVKGALWRRNHP
ncbi:MAG: hypothetical protein ACKOBZ_01780 [Nitrospira sp.]